MTLAQLFQGGGELPLVAQSVAKVAVGFGEVRLEVDGFAELLDRRVQLRLGMQGGTEVIGGLG